MKTFSSRHFRLLLSALLSFLITINSPAFAAHWQNTSTQTANSTIVAQASTSLLQVGIRHYQATEYSAAINSWNRALNASSDVLTQALLLSNLSLAHQHLSQWSKANQTISQSLELLAIPTETTAYSETLAKALNTQGRLHWATGDTETALVTWRRATVAYRQANNLRGTLLSLINQAKALQTLGQHLQSETILQEDVYPLLQSEAVDPTLRASGLWQLGNAGRQLGKLSLAEEHLNESLKIIEQQQLDHIKSSVLLDLANTERALARKKKAIGEKSEASNHRQQALEHYQQAVASTNAPMTQLQANLNRLSLLIETKQWADASALWPDLAPDLENLLPGRTTVYAQLNFANSLMELMEAAVSSPAASITQRFPLTRGTVREGFRSTAPVTEHPSVGSPSQGEPSVMTVLAKKQSVVQAPKPPMLEALNVPTTDKIDAIIRNAIRQAEAIADPIATSYGIGQRGKLYELTKDYAKAQELTQQALQLTEQQSFPDGRYRWEWQQGRLFNHQGRQAEALEAYGHAVDTLKTIRRNLLFIDAEVQFSFRDNVEPVYRELVELLLSKDAKDLDEATLDQAVEQIDNLQLSELENFLRCDLTATTKINQFEVDASTAILHPILLEQRLGVISQFENGKKFTTFDIPKAEAKKAIKQLRSDLSEAPDRTPAVRQTAKLLYQWLIAPIEPELQRRNIKTLVFVLDGPLRNIPMAVLLDGQQYLIEKYAIAIAPELELFKPTALTQDLKVFTGGVGTPQEINGKKFPIIEKLDEELEPIDQLFGTQKPVTNQDFNRDNIAVKLSNNRFSGIHIKTHGVFSSDPDSTFIVGHEELISGEDLGNLIQIGSRQGTIPIELLVLSACSTATGDNRAILGLAGIAVRAGARSSLSTLWEAEDIPNTELMIQFYQELQTPNITRAQALQNAQLALMKNPSYGRIPHYWASYVLVGNWL
ncbi:MAG: CHAT domain-containing protein [Cyanobacteria bacterium P01_D01_bin.156]